MSLKIVSLLPSPLFPTHTVKRAILKLPPLFGTAPNVRWRRASRCKREIRWSEKEEKKKKNSQKSGLIGAVANALYPLLLYSLFSCPLFPIGVTRLDIFFFFFALEVPSRGKWKRIDYLRPNNESFSLFVSLCLVFAPTTLLVLSDGGANADGKRGALDGNKSDFSRNCCSLLEKKKGCWLLSLSLSVFTQHVLFMSLPSSFLPAFPKRDSCSFLFTYFPSCIFFYFTPFPQLHQCICLQNPILTISCFHALSLSLPLSSLHRHDLHLPARFTTKP